MTDLYGASVPPSKGVREDAVLGSELGLSLAFGAEERRNFVSALLMLLATALELGIRETFYSTSTEAPGLLLVTALTVLLLILWVGLRLVGTSLANRRTASKALVLIAVAVWLRSSGVGGLWASTWWGGLIIGAGAGIVWRLDVPRWTRFRRAVTVAILIFVLSQPVLAFWRASELSWPPRATVALGPSAETTVIVLLDELSANAAAPVADAMKRSGSAVVQRAINPSGDGTGKVVPSLFVGHAFKEARPCSWHTMCSESDALDIGRIQASRSDIDVVGFYFPYCAIKGLRSCEVLSPGSPYFDISRWHCAAQRRSDLLTRFDGEMMRRRCAAELGQVWASFGDEVQAAIWRAPVWRRGGLLFVHVPLPHPPGVGGSGSLELDYRANIAKAAQLIGTISERLASNGRPFSLVVFSDHPLRPEFWCESTQYRRSCPPSADLLDSQVPLLATGVISPAVNEIRSNMEIFKVIVVSGRTGG